MKTNKKRTPPREKYADVDPGIFKKTVPTMTPRRINVLIGARRSTQDVDGGVWIEHERQLKDSR
jgi:hypothetical protein